MFQLWNVGGEIKHLAQLFLLWTNTQQFLKMGCCLTLTYKFLFISTPSATAWRAKHLFGTLPWIPVRVCQSIFCYCFFLLRCVRQTEYCPRGAVWRFLSYQTCHTWCKLILIIKASYSVPCWEGRHFYYNKVWHQSTHLIPNICSQIMKTENIKTFTRIQL